MVGHTCNLSTEEPEAGGSQVCGEPELPSEMLVYTYYQRGIKKFTMC